jgi:hypothetical protein
MFCRRWLLPFITSSYRLHGCRPAEFLSELDTRFAVTLDFHSDLNLSENCLSIKPYRLFGNKKSENNDDLSVLASTKS